MSADWLTDLLGPKPAPRVVNYQSTPYTPPSANTTSQKPSIDIQALLAKLQGAYDQSNSDSAEQYKNLLGAVNSGGQTVLGQGGIYDQAANLMSTMGQTANRRIGENQTKNLASSEQDLITRGLGNTTIRNSARRGINVDAENARQDVNERVAGAQAGLLTQKAGTTMDQTRLLADSILSRSNQVPDAGMYAQLLQQLGAAGGGGSFNSGGGGAGGAAPFGGSSGGGKFGQGFGGAGGGGSESGGVQTFIGTGPGATAATDRLTKKQGTLSGYTQTPRVQSAQTQRAAASGGPTFFPGATVAGSYLQTNGYHQVPDPSTGKKESFPAMYGGWFSK